MMQEAQIKESIEQLNSLNKLAETTCLLYDDELGTLIYNAGYHDKLFLDLSDTKISDQFEDNPEALFNKYYLLILLNYWLSTFNNVGKTKYNFLNIMFSSILVGRYLAAYSGFNIVGNFNAPILCAPGLATSYKFCIEGCVDNYDWTNFTPEKAKCTLTIWNVLNPQQRQAITVPLKDLNMTTFHDLYLKVTL